MYLGIEIGGTKLQAALGDGAGRIDRIERTTADAAGGRERICEQIASLAKSLLPSSMAPKIVRAGIGFGGPVDPASGRVLKSHQVSGWDDFPIVEWFREQTGIAAFLGNDSDLAGLAEAHFGAGAGHPRVVYLNIGSGIGGAIVLDGKVYTSQGAGASEIGHLRVFPATHGKPWLTLEELSSGWSLAKYARRGAELDAASELSKLAGTNLDAITAETLIEAVRRNDPLARNYFRRAIQYLGVAMANVITLLRPEVFVVGGGVALAGDILFDPLRKEVDRQAFAPFRGSYSIVPAQLGETVVLHGALKLACDGMQ